MKPLAGVFSKFAGKAALSDAERKAQAQSIEDRVQAIREARDELGRIGLKIFNLLIPGAIEKIDIYARPAIIAPGQPERKYIGSVLVSKIGAFEVLDVDLRPEADAPAEGADAPEK